MRNKEGPPQQLYFAVYDEDGDVYTGRQIVAPDEEPAPREMSKAERHAANPVLPYDLLSRRFQPAPRPASQAQGTLSTAEDTQL